MKVRGFKRVAAGVAAASALALGVGVVAPTVASAAPADVDVTPAASSTLTVTQDGNDVSVAAGGGWLGGVGCGVSAVDAGRALEVYADPIKIVDGGAGIHLFPATIIGGKSTQTLDNGVYVVMGWCPGDTSPNIKPIIVPNGIGSVAGAADFGSAVIQNPDLLTDLIGLIG